MTIKAYHAPPSHRIQRKPISDENKVGAGGVLRRRQYRPRQSGRRTLLPIRLNILLGGTKYARWGGQPAHVTDTVNL